MKVESILLYFFLKSFVVGQNLVTFLDGKDPNIDRDAYVIQLNCSNEINSLFFDIQSSKWTFSSAEPCLRSLNDILFYCQRVYPRLNILNIQLMSEKVKVKTCISKECSNSIIHGSLFKCLYGVFKSKEQLFVPINCQFEHLMSKKECQTTKMWTKLANQKCQTKKQMYYMTNYSMIQWCDAFKDGIGTFNGIEFVCCPENSKTKKGPYEDENIDESQQYVENFFYDDNEQLDIKNVVNNVKIINKETKNAKTKLLSYATTFFLIGFFMTVFIFIFVRFIKKRRYKSINRERFNQHLDKNQDSQLDQMQINGYENPTYKFFDEQNLTI